MLVTYIKITEDRQELTRQHNLIMDCLGRRGLSRREISARLNVSRTTLYNFLKSKRS